MADVHTESVLRFAKINAELRERAEAAEARLAETQKALERLVARRDVNETWEETILARAALTTHHTEAKP